MKVCLIGGSGRSGTTVLSDIFSLHPDLVDVPEWRFLIDPDGVIDFYNSSISWSPYHQNIRLKRFESLLNNTYDSSMAEKIIRYLDQLLMKYLKIEFKISRQYSGVSAKHYSPNFMLHVKALINDLNEFSFFGEWVGLSRGYTRNQFYNQLVSQQDIKKILRRFLLNIMNDVVAHQHKKHYLEKNTWNILWFDKIQELLPESKMVHIYRDPRDVVTSFSQQTWMPDNVQQCAIVYRDLLDRWENIKSRISTDSYIEVSLESLVADPESIIREICQFWGITWCDSLLDIDLSKSNSGRWKNELSSSEIASIETILNKSLQRFRYIE